MVLVLAARPRDPEPPEVRWLVSADGRVKLRLVDGELRSVRAQAKLRCPGKPAPLNWGAERGLRGKFRRQAESQFVVTDEWTYRGERPPSEWTVHVQGRWEADRRAARGRVFAVASRGWVVCHSERRFRAE